jgi:hypothetical protein
MHKTLWRRFKLFSMPWIRMVSLKLLGLLSTVLSIGSTPSQLSEPYNLVKKPPTQKVVGEKVLPTKQEAERYAIEFVAEKKKQGYNIRHEVFMVDDGQFKVRFFYYAEDSKGNLV